jgi:Predicted membrane protein (DUF2207).
MTTSVSGFSLILIALQSRLGFALFAMLPVMTYITLCFFHGRSPRSTRLVPQFAPPSDMEAGYVGYVVDLKYGPRLLLADLMQLAVAGQIELETGTNCLHVFKVVEEWGAGVSDAHKRLLDNLFQETDDASPQPQQTASLSSRTDASRLGNLYHAMHLIYGAKDNSPTGKYPRLFYSNTKLKFFGLPFFLPLITMIFWIELPEVGENGAIPIMSEFWGNYPLFATGCIILSIVGSMLFARMLSARTQTGQDLLNQVKGFDLYLAHAGNPADKRIAMRYPFFRRNAPDMSIELFEYYLPYAFALRRFNAWLEAFAPLLGKNGYRPHWYRGTYESMDDFRKDFIDAAYHLYYFGRRLISRIECEIAFDLEIRNR